MLNTKTLKSLNYTQNLNLQLLKVFFAMLRQISIFCKVQIWTNNQKKMGSWPRPLEMVETASSDPIRDPASDMGWIKALRILYPTIIWVKVDPDPDSDRKLKITKIQQGLISFSCFTYSLY